MVDGTGRRVTIADVARHAGVSQASVSRIVNGSTAVDPAIAERVRAAVAELDYVPSVTARSLARGRTNTIALVAPDLGASETSAILAGLVEAAGAEGHRVLVADSTRATEAVVATEMRRRADALVLVAPRLPDEELRQLARELAPVILVDRLVPDLDVPQLGIVRRAAMDQLLEHVLDLGHRHLMYLSSTASGPADAAQERAIDDIERRRPDITVERRAVGRGAAAGYQAAAAVLSSGVTVALAADDELAIGLMARVIELGFRVPENLAITGFGDLATSAYAVPSLTTVTVPSRELGVAAWAHLREILEGRTPPPPPALVARPVFRASTTS